MTSETADTWNWPDSLDARVAAPEFHRLVLENDDVRVLETRIGPGDKVPLHTHRWPSILYVLSTGDFVRRDDQERVLVDTRVTRTVPEPGAGIWMDAMPPHTFENVGDSEVRVLTVELKR